MKQNILEKHPATVNELNRQTFAMFLAILDDYIHRLYWSIPNRIKAVLRLMIFKANAKFVDFVQILSVLVI